MAIVHIPPQLLDVTGGAKEVEVSGRTMRAVLVELETAFPGIESRILQDGRVIPGLAFSVDHVVTTRGLLAQLDEDSVVHIVPGIAGG